MRFSIICICGLLDLFGCQGSLRRSHSNENGSNRFSPPYRAATERPEEATAEGIARLTTSLLHDIHLRAGRNFNILLSPTSLWTILAMLLEGAGGRTERELRNVLDLSPYGPEDARRMARSAYKAITKFGKDGSGQTDFSSVNFIIGDKKLSAEFKSVAEQFYDAKYFNFDKRRKNLFTIMLNGWAGDKTNGKMNSIVSPAMLDDLVLLIGNGAYFKAKWRHPFDPFNTYALPFKDEYGNVIDSVPMMSKTEVLPIGYHSELECQILEIPYADNTTSMIIILPRQKGTVGKALSKMRTLPLRKIIDESTSEESVQLSLPRFHVTSKMYLNEILKNDLPSMFSPRSAEFPQLGADIFVGKIFQKAEIENSEEGTTASAVTSVQFSYKSASTAFRADRPFIYLINEIKTRTVLFAGTYSKPPMAPNRY